MDTANAERDGCHLPVTAPPRCQATMWKIWSLRKKQHGPVAHLFSDNCNCVGGLEWWPTAANYPNLVAIKWRILGMQWNQKKYSSPICTETGTY